MGGRGGVGWVRFPGVDVTGRGGAVGSAVIGSRVETDAKRAEFGLAGTILKGKQSSVDTLSSAGAHDDSPAGRRTSATAAPSTGGRVLSERSPSGITILNGSGFFPMLRFAGGFRFERARLLASPEGYGISTYE